MSSTRRISIGGSIAVSLLLALSAARAADAGEARPRVARVWVRGHSDAYVLARGGHFMSSDASIEEIEALGSKWSPTGDFLWVRRGGREFLIRDARTMEESQRLFQPLKQLEPEQEALRRRRREIDSEERALEREQEDIEEEIQALEDRDEDDDSDRPVVASARPDLDRRHREVEEKMRALEDRERELDAAENELDRRSDALEEKAEAGLWRLIDGALGKGLGRPAAGSGSD